MKVESLVRAKKLKFKYLSLTRFVSCSFTWLYPKTNGKEYIIIDNLSLAITLQYIFKINFLEKKPIYTGQSEREMLHSTMNF